VSRIDSVRRRIVATIKVGSSPVNLDVVGREVWVPNDQSNTLSRIDIASNSVIETIKTGRNTAVVAGVEGEVWVTNFDEGSVWRIKPGPR
jgi:YVTN family beta-propeller protein